jgi:hypothetical protein
LYAASSQHSTVEITGLRLLLLFERWTACVRWNLYRGVFAFESGTESRVRPTASSDSFRAVQT